MRTLFLLAAALCRCYLHAYAQDVNSTVPTAESKGIASIPEKSLSFLKGGDALQSLSPDKLKQIGEVQGQLKALQARMQQANDIQAYIRERQQELKQQLKDKLLNSSIIRSCKSMNKEAFYYEQRLREYKDLISDKQKLELKALEVVRNLPAF